MADSNQSENVPLISCAGLFSELNDLNEKEKAMIEFGSCIDPETARIQGTKIFNDQ